MKYLYTFLLFTLCCSLGFSQTSLKGKVMDENSEEHIIYGNVAVFQDGKIITGTEADYVGNYVFKNIEPGIYDVEATYVGYITLRITEVIIEYGKDNVLDFCLSSGVIQLHNHKKKRRFPKIRLGKKKAKQKTK